MVAYCLPRCLFIYIPLPLGVATTVATIVAECSACAVINKSGKYSCCARGGAWFNNCGRAGDTTFGHTWTEGLKACKSVASLGFGRGEITAVLLDQTIASQQLNIVQNRTARPSADSTHSAPTANSRNCCQLPQMFLCVTLVLALSS